MLHIATINQLHLTGTKNNYAQVVSAMHHHPVDLLFGQTACISGSDPHSQVRGLAQSINMTYMYSNSSHKYATDTPFDKHTKKVQTGFSILTGKNCWMLNSGSLSLNETKKETPLVQFGIMRVNSNSVLVINIRFSDDSPKKQLLQLLSHPILNEQFGALIINSNINLLVGEKAQIKVMDSKGLTLHRSPNNTSACSSLSILTSKETQFTSITMGNITPLPGDHGQITTLEMTRLPKNNRRKKYQPLSFRERWLGSGDGYRAFAY